MPTREFAEQSLLQGTPLLKELSRIVEAHVVSDAATSSTAANGEGVDNDAKMTVATFTGKKLESSRKYGGTSMLYYGKL